MVLVTICGASGSGKTALADNISAELQKLGVTSRVLALDSYYICRPDLPFSERTLLNYDAPTSFDFDLLKTDLENLRLGKPINMKAYDYGQHLRHDSDALIYPPQVLLLEGIHAFADSEILAQSDLRLYVDTDPDVCIMRRVCRDIQKRDRTVQAIAEQYFNTVKPMFERYIRLYRNDADMCVVGGGHNARAVKVATLYIMSLLN